ncbi:MULTISPECIES: Os1348 family NHLP clan protein [unclassified Solwaraspora]|uniref:Os1348 family NHLP clan protein n=1 Tax=unclassified Solwaraspora TaxID=2627926 RepID=UPI00259BB572|nr:Os1348 family NHLP clan protein [Solwaraspora sp. WMMA2056]WJK40377.1 Os1348 family NHLP clan protein [Solwaraspora sp. WMMA2056]
MSDFDTVLERLLTDAGFAARLAADPVGALAGYQLTADERELLATQAGDAAPGATAAVETRANQSSAFGLFSPLTGMLDGFGDIGSAVSGFGGAQPPASGFGAADPAVSGLGPAPAVPSAEFGAAPVEPAGFGSAPVEPVEPAVPEGYRTRVDVDGDGEWDQHLVRGRADGGVDILVDHDGDGRVDFVGRDDDADGLVESAAYDVDGDGHFETVAYDDDGDGWLDRSVTQQPPSAQPAPSTPTPPAAVGPPATPPVGGGLLGDNLRLPEELR